jgi:hypothetical protein
MTFPSFLNQFFIHGNEYFKYLLIDLRYMGKEMFVMHCIERHRLTLSTNVDAIKAYNEMHASYKVKVECSIGGFKHKLKRLMKIFDCTKPKSNHQLQTYVLLIKFMHKCQWDFTFEVIGEH